MRSLSITLLLAASVAWAEPPRARPPVFTDEDRAAFFDNAFDALVGERPEPAKATDGPKPTATAPTATIAWDELIAADVLETEIKRQASALAKATRSASSFKAGGYRDAVDALGNAAIVFAIVHEHPAEPRWSDMAEAISVKTAAWSVSADAASDEAYAAAEKATDYLQRLIRGERDNHVPKPEYPPLGDRASRTTLMRRMGAAEEERLRGWVAGGRAFRRNSDDIRHEAQVLAALAEAILRPEAYDFDDPDYQAHARKLRDASVRLSEAAEAEDQPAAAEAMTEVSRSCVDCHADYRG